MKNKLIDMLGGIGVVVYFLVSILISILPFLMIDASPFLTFVFIAIVFFIRPTSIIFWVWGLVCAIQGPQNALTIIYYILFAVFFLPFFFSVISDLLQSTR